MLFINVSLFCSKKFKYTCEEVRAWNVSCLQNMECKLTLKDLVEVERFVEK